MEFYIDGRASRRPFILFQRIRIIDRGHHRMQVPFKFYHLLAALLFNKEGKARQFCSFYYQKFVQKIIW